MISWIEVEFLRYKQMGESTIAQLGPDQLVVRASPESLSIATIVWHVAGNLTSRFTDFLTSDGEKPWRNRESEFEERNVGRKELLEKWESGWGVLLTALESLDDGAIERGVTVRGVPLTVGEALLRSLAHVSYHVGQMTFVGKMLRGREWDYLTIPPGGTVAYNENPTHEKGPGAR
ncbi:MAG TPA: DUF1572 family protein [Longimicrobiales bacterium]|nr:DUF1572 family protein [Longimicrobiales bacterium]